MRLLGETLQPTQRFVGSGKNLLARISGECGQLAHIPLFKLQTLSL